jgi:hypothetical protein
MGSSKQYLTAVSLALIATSVTAARVDLNDPRRALGREDDVRVDASLTQANISASSPLNVTYQIQNLSPAAIAFADKVSDASWDADSQTITLSLGAEIPPGPSMPRLVVIQPGEKRVFCGGAMVNLAIPATQGPWTRVPRFVQIKVNILRTVMPFAALIEQQSQSGTAPALPNDMFDRWVDSNDAVYLNPIPVRWSADRPRVTAENNSGGSF